MVYQVGTVPALLLGAAQPAESPLSQIARVLHLPVAAIDVAALIVLLAVALVLGYILKRLFRRYALKFEGTWGELILTLLESLPIPLLILAALYTALEQLSLPPKWDHTGSEALLVLAIVVLFYFPAKGAVLFLERLSVKQPALERVTQPATLAVRILFAMVAMIVVLENLGIHLTAVWTTLGVGSVAVALALQDTLGNFFAGLYIMMDRPINLNDYIRLDAGGQEGTVTRIGWRSTQLRTIQNNTVVVPNSTLAKAVVTNYSVPEERLAVAVQVGAAYGTDARRVEKLLVEIAGAAASEGFEGLLATPEPVARLVPGFGPSTLDFTLTLHAQRFSDQAGVQSELRKRILERFATEGIEMPFPTQNLILSRAPHRTPREGERS